MNPPFSVIFLTTLIRIKQGLFLAIFAGQCYAIVDQLPPENADFYVLGSLLSLLFLIGGLVASFFHLGHPERAWRAATQWRTSWLSREVIALPLFMLLVFVYGLLHFFDYNPMLFGVAAIPEVELTIVVGSIGVIVCIALFVCTGMIYACLKFLQEWHTPLTPINYTLLGSASGFTLAALFAGYRHSELFTYLATWAVIITLLALITRSASLIRNYQIKTKSSLQTAIGVRHTRIQQKAQGSMGGSFNTREFFHGKKASFLKSIKWIFMLLVFILPTLLMSLGVNSDSPLSYFQWAFILQYSGLLFERWFFFAQARHPQNLYYQTI